MKTKIIRFFYKNFLKKIYFQMDPEKIHDRIVKLGELFGNSKLTQTITKKTFYYSNKKLNQTILNINFPNPIGLAAGFDKDAQLTQILPCLSFGFSEVGSITGEPCLGNPKPRLWRLVKSKGLVVYYGLKNDGCEAIAKKLQNKKFQIPIGISIAKTNCKDIIGLDVEINDYVKAYQHLNQIGHYLTINISCPNAFGGEPFTDPKKLDLLLNEIFKIPKHKPIFIKISPDLETGNLDQIIEVAEKYPVDGFVCSNLTKKKESDKIRESTLPSKGGISGKPVEDLANNLISYIYKKTEGKFIIMGCGGVFSAEDAYKKIKLGASLIQLITGMIYEGPQLITEINSGLVKLLEKDGFNNISEAVGVENKQ